MLSSFGILHALTHVFLAFLSAPATHSLYLPKPSSLSLLSPVRNNDAFNPQCHRLNDPGMPGLNPTKCREAANLICEDLSSHPIPYDERGRWTWVELAGCAVGFNIRWGMVRPTFQDCSTTIFGSMRRDCGYNSKVNAATINVMILPDFSQDGMPYDANRPMYMMAPERQTL